MSLAHHLTPYLKQLRLSGILDTLEVRNQQAIAEQWSYLEFLTRLIQDEVERRGQKQLDLRVRRSGISTTKTLESFDFGFNPTINRQQIYDLATCEFIRQQRNVLICGQTGVGKSHLAQSVAHEAARKGFDVVFTSAHAMLTHLQAGRADGTYERRLAGYFGLKPLPRPLGPADLFDVIDGRYEKASIVLTSNRSPSEWHDLFGDPLLASAGLDRLAHRASVVLITGQSYRLAQRAAGLEEALFAAPPAATAASEHTPGG
jgi:DNA replication protein DnaC